MENEDDPKQLPKQVEDHPERGPRSWKDRHGGSLIAGAAMLALVLLTWTYVSSNVMLFGAQLTAVLHCRHEAEDRSGYWSQPPVSSDETCDPSISARS